MEIKISNPVGLSIKRWRRAAVADGSQVGRA
jgi:hypothetical protein